MNLKPLTIVNSNLGNLFFVLLFTARKLGKARKAGNAAPFLGKLHYASGLLFAVFAVAHIALNWEYFKNVAADMLG